MTSLSSFNKFTSGLAQQEALMPVLFIGHGSPMNGIEDNEFSQRWTKMAKDIPVPAAVLVVSAHWFRKGTMITAMDFPKTIHDFGGFPQELFDVQYNAPGDTALAKETAELIHSAKVELDHDWGLDHGTWSVLKHVYPDADVPVVQLSIDETQPASFHFEIGRRLAPLRSEGILIVWSGNLVHNLHTYAWGRHMPDPYDWAIRFEKEAKEMMIPGGTL